MPREPGTGGRSVEELLEIAHNVARYARRLWWPPELGPEIDQLAEQADRACHRPAASVAERKLLDTVSWLYMARFIRGGDAQDAVTAVERFARLYGQVASRPAEVFLHEAQMLMLADMEQSSPERLGTAAALFEAAAGFASPGSDQWARSLHNAAIGWQRRYADTGDLNDLVHAVRGFERLSETGAGEDAVWPAMLGWCLARWREQSGDPARGRSALRAWDRAYRMASSTSSNRPAITSDAFNEAVTLWSLTGRSADRSAAVRWGARMVRRGIPDEERLGRVEALAADAFRQGSRGAVRDAARLFRAAADATRPDSPERARRQASAVTARDECWKQTGRPADLDLVIDEARAALRQLQDDHPSRREVAGLLAERLRQRHGLSASAGDLDGAIALLEGLIDDAGPDEQRSIGHRPLQPTVRRQPIAMRKPDRPRRRLFILGAGASYGAGLPDGGRLPGHVISYLTGPYEIVRHRAPWDYFHPLTDILKRVVYDEQSTGRPQWTWPLDGVFTRMLELREADPERFALPFKLLHEAIAQVLYCRSCHGGRTEAYRRFVETLDPTDVVLTFNWDVCLEIALHGIRRPFSQALVGSPPIDRPWILKLHGSVDYLVLMREYSDGQQTQTYDLPNHVAPLDLQPPPLIWTGQDWAPSTSNAAPPAHPSTPRMIHEATRLRTYDLVGDFEDDYPMLNPDDDESSPRIASYEYVLNPDTGPKTQQPERPGTPSDGYPGQMAMNFEDDESWEAPDVRPYRLAEAIQPTPSFLMLSPATPEWVYQWYYDRVLSCVYQVAADIDQIFVVGYSFPPYDRRVFDLLKDVVARAPHPPVDIVNPGASDLPQDILKSIFGRPRLHNNGFQEFPWSKRGV
jgi:hypothetical protein